MPDFDGSGPNVHVHGSSNTTNTAGRDLHVHAGAEELVELDLASLRGDLAPRGAARLAAQLRERRVLVLAGAGEDKPRVAHHVAAELAREERAPVFEWAGESGLDALQRGMRRKEPPAVIVLPRILPQHVDWNLTRLRAAAREAGHWVVATTDRSQREWHLGEGEGAYWRELQPEDLFDTGTIVTALLEEIEGVRGRLPQGTFEEAYDPGESVLFGQRLRDVAERLRTLSNVEAFGGQLRQRLEDGTLDAAGFEQLLRNVTTPAFRVRKWFHTALGRDEQLLALGLSLFDRLPDDQFFAALERWVAQIRERRDPGQRAFDYADLARLDEFFLRVETADGGIRLEPRWPGQREALLGAAWEGHRRQMLGSLDVLTRLAADSVAGRGSDSELYGSAAARLRVRRAVAAALGGLGTLSPDGVEPALLRLASDAEGDVQAVTASALAGWRLQGGAAGERFFAVLRRWQRDAQVRGMVAAMLAGRDERRSGGAYACIRATVALAVGYAAEYDPPNQLTPELVRLLEELAGDRNQTVRERFTGYTLPRAVRLHVGQLRFALRGMLRRSALRRPIATSLAEASPTRPDEVVATLNSWHAECAGLRPSPDPGRAGEREALLITLAYVYGQLPYGEGSPVPPEEGFARLKRMLASERHPRVRSAVVYSIGLQALGRFEAVEPMLQETVGEVSAEESEGIVRTLADVYLAQRQAMKGASDEVEVRGSTYPAWIDRPRPLTALELAMLRWMRDARHPAAQRIAVRTTLACVEALDGPEANEIARIRDERRRAADGEADDAGAWGAWRPVATEPGWYTGGLVPWLATRQAPQLYPVVRGLLPEALAQKGARPTVLQYALSRWEGMRGDGASRDIAIGLRSAIGWYTNAGCLIAIAAVVFLVILIDIL
jgi:hypothetical protein